MEHIVPIPFPNPLWSQVSELASLDYLYKTIFFLKYEMVEASNLEFSFQMFFTQLQDNCIRFSNKYGFRTYQISVLKSARHIENFANYTYSVFKMISHLGGGETAGSEQKGGHNRLHLCKTKICQN